MAEPDRGRAQRREPALRIPVLRRVGREQRRRLMQAGDRRQHVHVEEHVAADQGPICLAPERHVAGGVSGGVEDGEPGRQRIALAERSRDRRALKPSGSLDDRGEMEPFDRRRGIGPAGLGGRAVRRAAPHRDPELLHEPLHPAGVVGVRMGQRDGRDGPAVEHPGDLAGRLLDAGVDQHIADQIGVDAVARDERQLPDIIRDLEHVQAATQAFAWSSSLNGNSLSSPGAIQPSR